MKSRECYERKKQDTEWRAAQTKKNKLRARTQKAKAVESFGGFCHSCRETFPQCVFEFHHLKPEEKEITPALMFLWSWENIQKELTKCIMLCANCHRIEHARLKGDVE